MIYSARRCCGEIRSTITPIYIVWADIRHATFVRNKMAKIVVMSSCHRRNA